MFHHRRGFFLPDAYEYITKSIDGNTFCDKIQAMSTKLQSPVRSKPDDQKAVKLAISLSRETYDALKSKATEGGFKVPTSQIIERAVREFLGMNSQDENNPIDGSPS